MKHIVVYMLMLLAPCLNFGGQAAQRGCGKSKGGALIRATLSQQATRERVTRMVTPAVPEDLRHRFRGIYAVAFVEFDEHGNVVGVDVDTAADDQLVERAVANALRLWKFKPAEDPCQRLRVRGTLLFEDAASPRRPIY